MAHGLGERTSGRDRNYARNEINHRRSKGPSGADLGVCSADERRKKIGKKLVSCQSDGDNVYTACQKSAERCGDKAFGVNEKND